MMDSQVLIGMLRRGQTGDQIIQILEVIVKGQETEIVSNTQITETSDIDF